MKKITEKQRKILEYIEFYIQVKGYPPSMRDMMKYFDLKSVSTIYVHLKSLEKKGYIELSGNSRGIKLKNKKEYGIIEIDGEYINEKVNLYNKPKYIKCISGIKIFSTEKTFNLVLKEDYKEYSKNTLIIMEKKTLNLIGTINIKGVIINENSYWF
ncbi:hypothetical protein JCM30566_01780 [Marinitoga arctica]